MPSILPPAHRRLPAYMPLSACPRIRTYRCSWEMWLPPASYASKSCEFDAAPRLTETIATSVMTGSASPRPPPDPQALPQVLGRSAFSERLNIILSLTPRGLESELHAFVDALATAAHEMKAKHKNFKWQPAKIPAHQDLFRHLDLVTEHIMKCKAWKASKTDLANYLVLSLSLLFFFPMTLLEFRNPGG